MDRNIQFLISNFNNCVVRMIKFEIGKINIIWYTDIHTFIN